MHALVRAVAGQADLVDLDVGLADPAPLAGAVADRGCYEHLGSLEARAITEDDKQRMLTILESEGDVLARLINEGRSLIGNDKFEEAIEVLNKAKILIESQSDDERQQNQATHDFAVQQLALATYKSGVPDKQTALKSGLEIISALRPDQSNDTETVGIAGAIRKRLWDSEKTFEHLDKAVEYYGRGFNLKQDYYNGENYATCLVLRAAEQSEVDEKAYDLMTAKKARKDFVRILSEELNENGTFDGDDAMWKYASLANGLYGLKKDDEAKPHELRQRHYAGDEFVLRPDISERATNVAIEIMNLRLVDVEVRHAGNEIARAHAFETNVFVEALVVERVSAVRSAEEIQLHLQFQMTEV